MSATNVFLLWRKDTAQNFRSNNLKLKDYICFLSVRAKVRKGATTTYLFKIHKAPNLKSIALGSSKLRQAPRRGGNK